jgi:hypothetical protein
MATSRANPDRPDSTAASGALRESTLMRSVNRNLRHVSERLAHGDPIMFFCECGARACHAPIWLSRASFDAVVAEEKGWQLVEAHVPSAPWGAGEPFVDRTAGSSRHDPLAAELGESRPHATLPGSSLRPWLAARAWARCLRLPATAAYQLMLRSLNARRPAPL